MKVGMKLQREREKGLEKIKEPRRGKEGESCFSFLVLLLERGERENEKFVSSHKSPS